MHIINSTAHKFIVVKISVLERALKMENELRLII